MRELQSDKNAHHIEQVTELAVTCPSVSENHLWMTSRTHEQKCSPSLSGNCNEVHMDMEQARDNLVITHTSILAT